MSTHEDIDAKLDRIVDTQYVSYTEAYASLGLTPPPTKPIKAAAIEKRLEDYDFYSMQFNQTGPIERTPEEQLRVALGAAACSSEVAQSRENRS